MARGFFIGTGSVIVLFVLCLGFVKVLSGEEITDLHRQYWLAVLVAGIVITGAGGALFKPRP